MSSLKTPWMLNSPPPSTHSEEHSLQKNNAKAPASSNATTPEQWWTSFCERSALLLSDDQLKLLAKAVEDFAIDRHKHDAFLLRIWLAYISVQWSLLDDEDETRRMYKLLKNSHLGVDSPDLYLRWANFECSIGTRL